MMDNLSRRERQIMDVIYERGQATAAEVLDALPDPPTYSTVRTLLRVLESKGHLRHRYQGPRYVFRPTVSRDAARSSALRRVMCIFFQGSAFDMTSALIDTERLEPKELDELKAQIEKTRQEGR